MGFAFFQASVQRLLSCRPHRVAALGTLCVGVGVGSALWVHERSVEAALVRKRASVQQQMNEDTPSAYRQVVAQGRTFLASGHQDGATQQMVAYAATILAIEHQDENSLNLSRTLLRPQGQEDAPPTDHGAEGYLTAARILASYGDGDLTEGMALAEAVRGVPEGLVMARLEGLRLMVAAKVEGPKIAAFASDLGGCVDGEVRALNYLGLWHLSMGNTAQGEAYFARAARYSPSHPQVRLGLQWVRLFAPHPLPEDVWRAQQVAQEVLMGPAHALTPPIRATALLVRAQASLLEGDAPRAERDRAEAVGLDPGNLLHEAIHDGPARP